MQITSPTFVSSTPGQDIDELVSRLSADQLDVVLGGDIVELIWALDDVVDQMTMIREVASSLLRDNANEFLLRKDIREICIGAMASEKRNELCERIGVSSLDRFDPATNENGWSRFLGFFGVDPKLAAPFAVAPDREIVASEFGLFPHQRKAADRVSHAIRGGDGRVVLHMPTGAGKTRTAMHVASRFLSTKEPGLVVWLANSSELLDQATEAFQKAWAHLGNRDIELLRFWGEHAPNIDEAKDGLIVAGLQKLNAFKTKDPLRLLRLARIVDLVIVDEAHQSIAPTYQQLIDTLSKTGSSNSVVGLTATPGRTWSDIEKDERLAEFFQGRKVMLDIEGWEDPVTFLMDQGYLARPTFRRLDVEATPDTKDQLAVAAAGMEYDKDAFESLAAQVGRNVTIINEARRLLEVGHKRIILFAASVRHAEILTAAFRALGIDSQVVTGSTNQAARARTIKAFRSKSEQSMILCNFGVLTTGFDAPNTSAAIIARPTKSLVLFSQMVGRATRGEKAGGNKTCEISTIVDIDLPGFGDVADAFTNWEDVWHEPTNDE